MVNINISKLARICTAKKCVKDEMIFQAGDKGQEMYIILAGSVSVEIDTGEGIQTQVSQLKSGDFFGEMSLLEGEPRNATIISLENTVLLVINQANLENVIRDEPSLAFRIMKGLSNRVRRQNVEFSRIKQTSPETQPRQIEVPLDKLNSPEVDVKDSNVGSVLNNKVVNQTVISVSGISPSWLYPAEHKKFFLQETRTTGDFIFDKKIICPVCNTTIEAKYVRFTKLALQKVDQDFRQHFINFEPLWYSVQVCPQCFYANTTEDFEKINDKGIKFILEESVKFQNQVTVGFCSPRDIDQVFTAYYLALYWLKGVLSDKLKEGKLWLRLAWLYEDVGDQALALMASEKALVAYKDTYHNGRQQTTVEQDQRLSILIGELCMRNNLQDDARKYFRDTIVHKGGNKTLNEKAQDRIREIH